MAYFDYLFGTLIDTTIIYNINTYTTSYVLVGRQYGR